MLETGNLTFQGLIPSVTPKLVLFLNSELYFIGVSREEND